MDEQLPPQPSFPRIAENLMSLSEEFSRCQNLPAVDGGLRILQVVEATQNDMRTMQNDMRTMQNDMHTLQNDMRTFQNDMRNDMRSLREELRDSMRTINGKLSDLDRKLDISNKNFAARMQNSIVVHDNVPLAPLYNVLTGDLANGCPSTLKELDAFTARQVDALLAQLGETGRGRLDAKRQQLEAALGVKTRAPPTV